MLFWFTALARSHCGRRTGIRRRYSKRVSAGRIGGNGRPTPKQTPSIFYGLMGLDDSNVQPPAVLHIPSSIVKYFTWRRDWGNGDEIAAPADGLGSMKP